MHRHFVSKFSSRLPLPSNKSSSTNEFSNITSSYKFVSSNNIIQSICPYTLNKKSTISVNKSVLITNSILFATTVGLSYSYVNSNKSLFSSTNNNNNNTSNPNSSETDSIPIHNPSEVNLNNLPTLKYPIVLCHGLFGSEALLHLPHTVRYYFNGIIPLLKLNKITVLAPSLPRSSSIENRAKALQTALGININTTQSEHKHEIDTISNPSNNTANYTEGQSTTVSSNDSSVVVDTNKPFDIKNYKGKYHLIAHSMGGLDCRYLTSKLQSPNENRILTVTTISTPHHGSPIAELFWNENKNSSSLYYSSLDKLFNFCLEIGLDLTAIKNLTPSFMKEFNKNVPMREGTYYYSYGGYRKFDFYSIWFLPSKFIELAGEGKSDGLVSVESSKYGNYIGTVPLDHTQQIGLITNYNHLPLYAEIIHKLAEIENAHFAKQAKETVKQKASEMVRAVKDEIKEHTTTSTTNTPTTNIDTITNPTHHNEIGGMKSHTTTNTSTISSTTQKSNTGALV